MLQALLLPVAALAVLVFVVFVFGGRGSHVISAADSMLIRRLRRTGSVVLTVGFISAALVYRPPQPAGGDQRDIIGYESGYGYSVPLYGAQSRHAAAQAEFVAGKGGIYAIQLMDWISGPWHGAKLAGLLGILSGAVFCGCFIWARILTFPDYPRGETRARTPLE